MIYIKELKLQVAKLKRDGHNNGANMWYPEPIWVRQNNANRL